jgi:hypothetical protein
MKIVSIFNPAGSSASATRMVASVIARCGGKVLVVDLDPFAAFSYSVSKHLMVGQTWTQFAKSKRNVPYKVNVNDRDEVDLAILEVSDMALIQRTTSVLQDGDSKIFTYVPAFIHATANALGSNVVLLNLGSVYNAVTRLSIAISQGLIVPDVNENSVHHLKMMMDLLYYDIFRYEELPRNQPWLFRKINNDPLREMTLPEDGKLEFMLVLSTFESEDPLLRYHAYVTYRLPSFTLFQDLLTMTNDNELVDLDKFREGRMICDAKALNYLRKEGFNLDTFYTKKNLADYDQETLTFLFPHIVKCKQVDCPVAGCDTAKSHAKHMRTCDSVTRTNCNSCLTFMTMVLAHSKLCKSDSCDVLHCAVKTARIEE